MVQKQAQAEMTAVRKIEPEEDGLFCSGSDSDLENPSLAAACRILILCLCTAGILEGVRVSHPLQTSIVPDLCFPFCSQAAMPGQRECRTWPGRRGRGRQEKRGCLSGSPFVLSQLRANKEAEGRAGDGCHHRLGIRWRLTAIIS